MIQSIQNFGRGGGTVGGEGTEGGGGTDSGRGTAGGGGAESGRGTEGGTSESLKLDIGQTVVYSDGQKSDMAKIKSWEPDNDGRRKSRFKIEFPDGSILDNVHKETLSLPKEVDPVVERVIGILNLRVLTDQHFRAQYPTQKEFEEFFLNSTEEFKAQYKKHGKWKEPLFKRSDTEEFILLSRWIEKNVVDGRINWDLFNKESFNNFRKQAPKDDLFEILKELGIYNDKVLRTLKAKNVLTPAHFVQKPKSWFDKLGIEELGTEENSNNLLFNGTEKYAIEKFRDWYSYRFVGYLPSDWIVTFRNDDVHPKERELRKVLRVIGLSADPVRALKMNDIRDITALNRTSKEWRTENRSGLFTSNSVSISIADRMHGVRDVERDNRSYAWKHMGLTRNDASDIITFRHWYNFYVSGKKNTKGWAAEFNSTHYRNFIQRYEPGDNFNYPNILRSRKDKLRISQEKHEYYDMLKKATEAGDVSEERRYHLLQYLEKREKMSLIEEITSQHDEGLAENSLQASRLKDLLHRDEKEKDDRVKNDLLFYQGFCQFFFSAFLVLTLLSSWIFTTAYLMYGELADREDVEENDYLTFIHNVVFGLTTAVVIQELGEEAKETSLYYRFLGTYREQVRRSAEYRYRNQLSLTGFRGRVKRVWNILLEYGKTRLMAIILWSTRLYIIVWIILGAVSLAFGAIRNLNTSNPLYTTGQTWLGIAVTIGYAYFGLSGKNTPKAEPTMHENDQQPDDAAQNVIDESGVSNATTSATTSTLEAKFTDEGGTTKVLKTRNELMKDIDTYNEMKEKARTERRFKEAAGYQKCLEQLDKLKQILPTEAELEKQLKEAEEEMNAAADANDFDAAEKLSETVEKLQEKIKEERNEEETWLGGDSTV